MRVQYVYYGRVQMRVSSTMVEYPGRKLLLKYIYILRKVNRVEVEYELIYIYCLIPFYPMYTVLYAGGI